MPINRIGEYKNLTATGTVYAKPGDLLGFFVSSTTSGTVVLKDGGASGTAITGTVTPTAGTWYDLPVHFTVDLHATIANTLDVTFVFTGSGA